MASGFAIRAAAVVAAIVVISFAVPQAQQDLAKTDGTAFADPGCNTATQKQWFDFATKSWTCQTDSGGGAGVPAGSILLIVSGTCPSGYAEETALNGKTLFGTLAANSDIGTTGGNDNITPAGTNSAPTFTGDAANLTHSGTAVTDHASHTHTYTDVVNHVHVQNVNTGTTGGSNGYGVDTSTNGSAATAISTANPTGGVATGTTNGPSATLTHSVTQPSAHSYTPTGSVAAPTFTGSSFDNRSAFARVIFCRKT